METQQDNNTRVVAAANLEAMCKYVSGMCHRYKIEVVTDRVVVISYSNPDEYGTDEPICVTFPCYPSCWPDDDDNPRVVLDMIGDDADEDSGIDAYQCFVPLLDCPTLCVESI